MLVMRPGYKILSTMLADWQLQNSILQVFMKESPNSVLHPLYAIVAHQEANSSIVRDRRQRFEITSRGPWYPTVFGDTDPLAIPNTPYDALNKEFTTK
jgi:hypothetical protein